MLMPTSISYASVLAEIAVLSAEGSAAPEWVHLMPSGTIMGRNGLGPYKSDPAAIIQNTLAYQKGADLPIDYDHQLLWSARNGQPAPAAGWIKELEARPDGIWGRVEWTERAAAHIASKEYRYLSPMFVHGVRDGVILRLSGAGLVNNPNFQLTAVASDAAPSSIPTENAMIHEDILKALGLAAGATIEQCVAAANQMAAKSTVLTKVTAILGVSPDDDGEAIAAAAQTKVQGQPDPSKYVPLSAFQELQGKVATMQKEQQTSAASAAVDAAVAAGKISPGMKDWAIGYASNDLAGFNAFVDKAPVLVGDSEGQGGGKPPVGKSGLTAEEVAIASQLGLTHEQFANGKNA